MKLKYNYFFYQQINRKRIVDKHLILGELLILQKIFNYVSNTFSGISLLVKSNLKFKIANLIFFVTGNVYY